MGVSRTVLIAPYLHQEVVGLNLPTTYLLHSSLLRVFLCSFAVIMLVMFSFCFLYLSLGLPCRFFQSLLMHKAKSLLMSSLRIHQTRYLSRRLRRLFILTLLRISSFLTLLILLIPAMQWVQLVPKESLPSTSLLLLPGFSIVESDFQDDEGAKQT